MVLLASTFLGGSVFTSICWESRSLIVGGFLFAVLPGAANSSAHSAAVTVTAPGLQPNWRRALVTASPSAFRSQRGHRSPPIHTAPESGTWRCAVFDLPVRGWREPVKTGSAGPTYPPIAAAIDPS